MRAISRKVRELGAAIGLLAIGFQGCSANDERTGGSEEDVATTQEALTRELLWAALHAHEKPRPHTAREVLQAAGRVRPLSDTLRRQIIPGVNLEEVRQALSQAVGPALSDMIQDQRGPKA